MAAPAPVFQVAAATVETTIEFPTLQAMEKTVEVPQMQSEDNIAEVLDRQTVQDTQYA